MVVGESAGALGQSRGALLSRPVVDVLEEVAVDVVGLVPVAGADHQAGIEPELVGPACGDPVLRQVQRRLVAYAQAVAQDALAEFVDGVGPEVGQPQPVLLAAAPRFRH